MAGTAPSTTVSSKILQVVQVVLPTQFATTSTTFVDLTGLSASITPSTTGSKIMVDVRLGAVANNNSALGVWLNLVRDSTNIAQPTDGVNKQSMLYYNADGSTGTGTSLLYLDSPSSTSSVNYKIQIRCNGGTAMVNRIGINTDWSCVSTMTLMEVAA